MAPKNPSDRANRRVGELVCFSFLMDPCHREGESLPRRDPKPAFERLGSIRSSDSSAKRRPEAKK